jgi:hypothetical protein
VSTPIKELEVLLNTFDDIQAYDSEDAFTKEDADIVFVTYGKDIENPNIHEMIVLAQCLVDIIQKSCRYRGIEVALEWWTNSYPTIVIDICSSEILYLIRAISCIERGFFHNKVGKQACHYQSKNDI